MANLSHGTDGAISDDNLIMGGYLHGLFESTDACSALLAWAGLDRAAQVSDYNAVRDAAINRLADSVDQHLDTQQLSQLLRLNDLSV